MRSWSQRRAAVEAEARAETAEAEAIRVEAFEADQAERSDAKVLEELGLPDPDSLEEGADFKGFLSENVPQRIKTRALRRLWRLNPLLANVDGLVDYGEDYTDAALVVEGMQTAYQVGKGMLKHIEALAAEAEAKEAAALEAPVSEEPEPVEAEEPAREIAPIAYAYTDTPADPPASEAVVSRRRMTFTFEETA